MAISKKNTISGVFALIGVLVLTGVFLILQKQTPKTQMGSGPQVLNPDGTLPPEVTISLSKAELQQAHADLPALLLQLHTVPNIVDGQYAGFRIRKIKKGSFLERLGLKRDMIVHEINGETLSLESSKIIFQSLLDDSVWETAQDLEIRAEYLQKPVVFRYKIVD